MKHGSLDRDILRVFFHWMNERHTMYIKRFEKGQLPPWTDDPILDRYKFTNVFRRLDNVSQYWKKEVYKKHVKEDPGLMLFNTVLFRSFNLPSTWEEITWHKYWTAKEQKRLIKKLERIQEDYVVFNGAYIISPGGSTGSKVKYVIESMSSFWKDKKELISSIYEHKTLKHACEILKNYPTMGNFTSYEIACDLRETKYLSNATDKLKWTNAGPGAKRGLNLIYGRNLRERISTSTAVGEIHLILSIAMSEGWKYRKTHPLEMREIEHSLCEFQKYHRVMKGGSTRRYIP